jgi:nitrite reductase/ring-hydroxylating ferredoxin subunit
VSAAGLDRVGLGRRAGRDRWLVDHDGWQLAVIVVKRRDRSHAQDEVVAVDAACPHRGGPLVEGTVRDGVLVCPWHWYAFDLATGACRTAVMTPVGRYDVVADGEDLYALVPPRAPTMSLVERLRAHAREGGAGQGT